MPVFLLFLFLLLFLFFPLVVRVRAKTEKRGVLFSLELLIFEVIRIPLWKKDVTVETVRQMLFNRKRGKISLRRAWRTLKKSVQVEEVNLTARIGTGSAASSALISSQAFALAAPLAAGAAGAENCRIEVTPVYDKKELFAEGDCVVSTDPLHILTGLIRLLGGKKHGKASD
ncbi:MAG: hypothetical protein J6X30_00620 [Clostridia bacterium]|nr:hypothetical protein [Clostridia bacterium]